MSVEKGKGLGLPSVLTVVAAALVIAGFFLPCLVSQGEMRERQLRHQEYSAGEELSRYEDLNYNSTELSMFEYVQVWMGGSEEGVVDETEATVMAAVAILSAGLMVVTAIFALAKKPVLAIIFTALAAGCLWLVFWDLDLKGSMSPDSFGVGIGVYVMVVGYIVAIIFSCWLFAEKHKAKKLAKAASAE